MAEKGVLLQVLADSTIGSRLWGCEAGQMVQSLQRPAQARDDERYCNRYEWCEALWTGGGGHARETTAAVMGAHLAGAGAGRAGIGSGGACRREGAATARSTRPGHAKSDDCRVWGHL